MDDRERITEAERAEAGGSLVTESGASRALGPIPGPPPPAVDATDPISPQTHRAGGTYAEGDYSPAARRSTVHLDQLDPEPGAREESVSGLASAQGGPAPTDADSGH